MGHRSKQWAGGPDHPWRAHGRHGGGWGQWGAPFEWGGPMGGPPPWMAGLFGMGQPERARGPRVRRGDVRTAILDVLAAAAREGQALNGYQVIQQIAERSGEAWRPSPGSVYPTIQQLQDEGLIDTDDERGRRALRLTAAGEAWVAEHADELAAVWTPFERPGGEGGEHGAAKHGRPEHVDLKTELGQVMPAVWQILTQGSPAQRRAAVEILADTRRRLYGVLADGPAGLGDDGDAEEGS